jgi:hypothetical protein
VVGGGGEVVGGGAPAALANGRSPGSFRASWGREDAAGVDRTQNSNISKSDTEAGRFSIAVRFDLIQAA